jgi:hypothetical protein
MARQAQTGGFLPDLFAAFFVLAGLQTVLLFLPV